MCACACVWVKEGGIYYKNMYLIKYIQQLGRIAFSDRSLQSLRLHSQIEQSSERKPQPQAQENFPMGTRGTRIKPINTPPKYSRISVNRSSSTGTRVVPDAWECQVTEGLVHMRHLPTPWVLLSWESAVTATMKPPVAQLYPLRGGRRMAWAMKPVWFQRPRWPLH